MKALADRYEGNAGLGRMLGHKDGAYVGQMISGHRPISEKTVLAVHAIPGLSDWFDLSGAAPTAPSPTVSATGGPSGISQDKTDIEQALTLLGQVIAASDKLTRAQIKPILDQLLESPEQAKQLGKRLQATVALNQGVPATDLQTPTIGGIAGAVLDKKLVAESRNIFKTEQKNNA